VSIREILKPEAERRRLVLCGSEPDTAWMYHKYLRYLIQQRIALPRLRKTDYDTQAKNSEGIGL